MLRLVLTAVATAVSSTQDGIIDLVQPSFHVLRRGVESTGLREKGLFEMMHWCPGMVVCVTTSQQRTSATDRKETRDSAGSCIMAYSHWSLIE